MGLESGDNEVLQRTAKGVDSKQMIEAGKKKKYRQEKEDAYAAAIILQTYLDKQNV